MEKNQIQIEQAVKTLLESIGENPNREGLQKTPYRVFKSFKHIFSGYEKNPIEILNSALFTTTNSEMVLVKDIEFYSMCEHHILPIIGKVHIAYIPNGKVTGLSKLPRVVEVFARRLQIQENMTEDIALAIQSALNPIGVGVVIEARHMCMEMRGVEKCSSITTTSSLKGSFLKNRDTRNEFFSLIKN
jgi:GTP cyclohydrolase I